MTTILLVLAVQIVVSVVLIVWTRSKVRTFLGSGDEIDRIRREIGALIVELDSSADRNVTVLEDRLSALKDMIIEADRRIALLGQEKTRRPADAPVYDRLGRMPEPRPESRPQFRQEPQPVQPVAQAQPVQPVQQPEPSVPFIRFSENPLPIEEPFADKVLSLSRRGFSSDIIAARLEVTMAEVDLVLSMERERGGLTKEP